MSGLDFKKLDALQSSGALLDSVRTAFKAWRRLPWVAPDLVQEVGATLAVDLREGPGVDRSGTAADTPEMKDVATRAKLWRDWFGGQLPGARA